VLAWLSRHWPSVLFVLCALGIWGWVSWEAMYVRMITWEGSADYWEHSATLHALIENPWHPFHPHLAIHAGSPRFGPQFLLIALIARPLHFDPLQAMALTAVLNTLLFLYGVHAFFLSYFRHPLAPLYGLLVMFGGWWHGFHYSNVYSLPELFAVASFPSTTALGLTLLGFSLTVRLLRGEARHPWLALLLIAVWAAAVFIIHPLTAMLSLSGAILLALAEPRPSLRLRLLVAGAVIVGCALSHFWPYFSPWVVLRGGHGSSADWASHSVREATAELHVKRRLHTFYRPSGLLQSLGAACITVVCLPYFFLRRTRLFVSLGALGMLVPFVANVFVEVPLGHRFLLLAIVYLQIGLVALLLRLTPGHLGALRFLGRRALAVISALLVAALLLVFSAHSVVEAEQRLAEPRFRERAESPVVQNMRAIAEIVGPHAVVLATPLLSWPLPTFGPKVLVLHHEDPLVPDAVERELSVKRFLSSGGSEEERSAIVARYGVTHVAVRAETGATLRFLGKHSVARAVGGGLHVYTLSPGAPKEAQLP
jgi:hypothetical protein